MTKILFLLIEVWVIGICLGFGFWDLEFHGLGSFSRI
jgi:hypothetical protein